MGFKNPTISPKGTLRRSDGAGRSWSLQVVAEYRECWSADCIFLVHFGLTHLSISSVFHLSLEYPQRLKQLKSSARRLALSEKLNVRI